MPKNKVIPCASAPSTVILKTLLVSGADTVGVNWKETCFHVDETPLAVCDAKTSPVVEEQTLAVTWPENFSDFT